MHGNAYDYSKVEYVGNKIKVIIICKLHGEFEQTPMQHLCGCGCSKCGYIRNGVNSRSNTEEFIEKSKKMHSHKYDYSLVNYVNTNTKVIIICKEHGEFEQSPNEHLDGRGCSKCGIIQSAINRRTNINDFIENAKKIHGDTYDYSLVSKFHIEFANTKAALLAPRSKG